MYLSQPFSPTSTSAPLTFSSLPSSDGRDPSFKCPRSGSGLFSNPTDCSLYTWCHEGRTYQLTCGPYMHFDPATGTCNHPGAAPCTKGVAVRVAGVGEDDDSMATAAALRSSTGNDRSP